MTESSESMQVDDEAVQKAIESMNKALIEKDMDAFRAAMKKVKEGSQTQALVDRLVPQLFETDPTTLTSNDALSVVGCLAANDANTFLKPISRALKFQAKQRSSSEQSLAVSPQLLAVVVSQLNGTDVEVSINATEAIVDFVRKLGPPLAKEALDQIRNHWQLAWENMSQDRNKNSTICVRCAAAVVDLASLQDNIMEVAESTESLTLLLELLTSDQDPLLQMSIMDQIERMATIQPMHPRRAHWLGSEAVLNPLLNMAGANDDDPDPINGGSALRVLSAICRLGQRDSSLLAHEALVGFHKALHNFQGSGELDRIAMVDAISSFASASPEALEMVLDDPVTKDAWLNVNVSNPKLKGLILTSVAMVIDPVPEVDANGEVISATNKPSNQLALKLFAQVGEARDSSEVALGMAKSPIPETRFGAYNLLRAVAKTHTGAQMLLSHTGFFEWLISREGESTKEGKEGKFEVVEAVLSSPAKALLADEIVQQLEKYVQQGPHYKPIIRPELMTD